MIITSPDTYEVSPNRPLSSDEHVGQVAKVGHDAAGSVHLVLTEAAAELLARVLVHYESLTSPTADALSFERPAVDRYDASFWTHVGIDLLAHRALVVSNAPVPADHVAVPVVDLSPTLGGAALATAAGMDDLLEAVLAAEAAAFAAHEAGTCFDGEFTCSFCEDNRTKRSKDQADGRWVCDICAGRVRVDMVGHTRCDGCLSRTAGGAL